MDGIKQQLHSRQMEAMENKHLYELRKRKRELRNELDKMREEHTKVIDRYSKEHKSQQLELKTKQEIDEAMGVALLVGGSIVIPPMRHAAESLEFLFNEQ